MSNRPGRKIARQHANDPHLRTTSSWPRWLVPVGIVALLALIVVGAVLLSGGDEDSSDSSDTAESGLASASAETSFAEIIGTGLPRYTGEPDAAVGATAPVVRATRFDDQQVTVEPGATATVMAFVAHWCPACQAEVPQIVSYLESNPVPEGVEFVVVSTSVRPDGDNYPPSAWLVREGLQATIVRDDPESSLATGLGLSRFPFFVVIAPDGTIVRRVEGGGGAPLFAELFADASFTTSAS